MSRLVSLAELAAVLKTAPNTIRGHALAGQVPYIRIGKALRFDAQAALAAYGITGDTATKLLAGLSQTQEVA